MSGTWSTGAGAPVAFYTATPIFLDNKIYLSGIGGSASSDSRKMYIYDVIKDSWTTGAQCSLDNQTKGVGTLGKLICYFGSSSRSVYFNVYEIATDSWSIADDFPIDTTDGLVANVDGKIYHIGGDNGSGNIGKKVYRLDVEIRQWTECAPAPREYYLRGCATAGSKIYCLADTDYLDIYDAKTNTWGTIQLESLNRKRAILQCAILGNYIYCPGAEGGRDFIKLDLATYKWSFVDFMPIEVHRPGVVEGNGKIFIIGGSKTVGGGNTDIVQIYTPDNSTTPVEGKCCCGELELKVKLPITNNVETLQEVNKLIDKVQSHNCNK